MKKILAFIMVMAMAIALLPGISTGTLPVKIQPEAPIVTDYCVPDEYSIGTFSLGPGQSVSINIPETACPPVKQGPILGIATINLPIGQLTDIGNIDADTAVIDIPQYQYNCYYKRPCSCDLPIVPNGQTQIVTNDIIQLEICFLRSIRVSANADCLSIQAYGAQEAITLPLSSWIQNGPEEWHLSIPELTTQITRIVITNNVCGGPVQGEVYVYECCCYDCYKQKPLPTTLYPKVDIETFSVAGGPTVIQDGKVISKFQMSPGSQQVLLQVENRGFFTQNDTRLRFDGLPEGITVEVTPETQKVKAHNIGTYSANFTVGPNVPSGTYQITMVAYSSNGMFDKITFEFVVQ